jgi:hypothetical protein
MFEALSTNTSLFQSNVFVSTPKDSQTLPQQPITTYYMYNGHKIKSETIPPPVPLVVEQQQQQPAVVVEQQPQINVDQPPVNKLHNPSLTAYPGDIFYKVKDVTESSTSDTLESFDESKLNITQNSPRKTIKFDTVQPTTTWKRQAIVHNHVANDDMLNLNDKVKIDDGPVISKELHTIR